MYFFLKLERGYGIKWSWYQITPKYVTSFLLETAGSIFVVVVLCCFFSLGIAFNFFTAFLCFDNSNDVITFFLLSLWTLGRYKASSKLKIKLSSPNVTIDTKNAQCFFSFPLKYPVKTNHVSRGKYLSYQCKKI